MTIEKGAISQLGYCDRSSVLNEGKSNLHYNLIFIYSTITQERALYQLIQCTRKQYCSSLVNFHRNPHRAREV